MRRIDAIGIGLLVFAAGGILYAGFKGVGVNDLNAGIWSQGIFILLILVWVATYLFRVVSGRMTYQQQRDRYEDAFLQKRLDEMSPEELAKLQTELAPEQEPDKTSP
jgi:membrane protein implicated in regulation of membrane protease activity